MKACFLILFLGLSSFGIAQTCLNQWQQCYVNPTQSLGAPCNYTANTGNGCCVLQCCSGLVCGGTSSDNVWYAACTVPSAVTAGQFSASFCDSGSTAAPTTTAPTTTPTKPPTTTPVATTRAPTTAAPTTTKPTTPAPTTTLAPTTTKPTTPAPTTTTPAPTTTTKSPTTTPAATTTTKPPTTTPVATTTTKPPTTTPVATTTTTPPTTASASCSIPIGSQCYGLPGSGSQCGTASSGCCAGCCASGQCGGSSSDNTYWMGCRAPGTTGGPTQNTCTGGTNPTTTPGPTSTHGPSHLYCPSTNDLVVAYGSPTIVNRGWTITGGGAVASKASYNLINGWVSYTVNWNGVPTGVNANIYSISPNFNGFNGASSFSNSLYCDGQPATASKPWCVEVDWIETDGNCGGQSTLHTYNVPDNTGGCGGYGCLADYAYNGVSSYVMNISFDSGGHWSVQWNGNPLGSLTPTAGTADWQNLFNAYTNLGAVIYSSQWVGWVPSVGSCSTTQGNLNAATMSISNLQIYGSLVQGPNPTLC